jgi:hypothetical protein
MLNDMQVNDKPLDNKQIRQLENADRVAEFFGHLQYDITERTNIPDYTILGMSGEDMRQQIPKIEVIGKDPKDGDIVIYLFEVRSITAKLRNDIARRFRERQENALLVLTKDYEELEFVLLERILSNRKSHGIAIKQEIRPIPLTVNRQNPDSIALRVLKRFTFTEEDSAYQWEKLRSAYMLAEWSEEYFNNRALFSDYYLKERLTDEKITPEWKESVIPVGREVYKYLINARQKYTRQAEKVIRKELFEPIFKQLGFDFKVGSFGTDDADYLLYAPSDQSKPIAAALTYVWNRNLDDVDESREISEGEGGTPFEIPGATVVTLLEKQIVPWVIVTNGKLWRLYSSTASNKATNYYEIDLEEAIAANDQITALKYWWLLFRPAAFTGFLDKLVKESADYAKKLGDRLKDRVFVDIFPQFAKGFIADMRAQGVAEADIDLDAVFSGTMTFLYRLMFVLYAESLELLPLNEVRGYNEHSLRLMKDEIKNVGGTIVDESPDKLKAHYKTNNTTLYTRLRVLFDVIDKGSDELNMPTYNGGLFSHETHNGQFLAHYAIPDQYLALGLDRLTRDRDDKTQALVFIDFKSLGVRQLGSIYEGLLEFKLKIASEALAVTKEKGKEIYQSANKVKKPLLTLGKGDVYLENDKQERKATGSYYTPDYIVKYIVRHTVGPVLDRKFKECEERLRKAQKGYRDYVKLVEARRKSTGKEESVTVYWNSEDMRQLVDDCLNVRVLDPAMGSGHFLVEVVDYISNRLIDFLNGWTENPVWAFIDQTRQDIIDDMNRQQVTIDVDRLTRVALLKRAVLKRCVYGVDLNQMAVELAKVSLWLDAFTLGAPLSFLDHHLKHGNSLIGARVADVQAALEGQQTLFSQNKFAGVMLATDLMRQVSYLSDNTIEQTRRSAQAYRDARDHLAPYKRVLDVYTSRWFGNAPIAGRRGSQDTDVTIEFLQRNDTQAWLEDPRKPENRLPADDYMKAGLVAKTALQAAEEKRFFHWELEFPEVFFAPSKPGGQDVQLSKDGGFDAVVGNPPYGDVLDKADKEFIRDYTQVETGGRSEIYANFIVGGLFALRPNGLLSYIVQNTMIDGAQFADFRKFLSANVRVIAIQDFRNLKVFDDAETLTMTLILQKARPTSMQSIEAEYWDDNLSQLRSTEMLIAYDSDEPWRLTNTILKKFYDDNLYTPIEPSIGYCKDAGVDYKWKNVGWQNRGEKPKLSDYLFYDGGKRDKRDYPVLKGADIGRYHLEYSNTYLIHDWEKWRTPESVVQVYLEHALVPSKILTRQTADRIEAVVDESMYVTAKSVHTTIISDANYNAYFVSAVLNSNLMTYVYRWRTGEAGRTFAQVKLYDLRELPIRQINFATSTNERERLTREAIGAYDIGDNADVLAQTGSALDAGKSDVVHDLLAHLAQRMIDLNKQKQTEVKRFLGWLEAKLKIRPKDEEKGIDSLAGKTVIQGYLGDYQKGESETSWQDFYYRLHQNRNRVGASLTDVEGEIQREYEKSLETLIPIKRDLARTDALIDKIVYRLYGLTDAEIELIERPQYEQALTDAKAQAIADDTIKGDTEEEKTEQVIDKIAEAILPAAQRFFERIEPRDVETTLDSDLPKWRNLPPDAPTFMLTGDYNLRSLPDHMDFSSSIIPYTKAVEVTLHKLIFEPFRNQYRYVDCHNEFLQKFMRGEKDLTIGSYMIILSSTRETALRKFMSDMGRDVATLASTLNDVTVRDIRNKAAHDEVLSRNEAQQTRTWAIDILRMV